MGYLGVQSGTLGTALWSGGLNTLLLYDYREEHSGGAERHPTCNSMVWRTQYTPLLCDHREELSGSTELHPWYNSMVWRTQYTPLLCDHREGPSGGAERHPSYNSMVWRTVWDYQWGAVIGGAIWWAWP